MHMSRIRELREERARCHEEASAILRKAELDHRPMSGEERAKWNRLISRMDELKAESDREEGRSELSAHDDLWGTRKPPEAQVGDHSGETSEERAYSRAFHDFLVSGPSADSVSRGMSPENLAVLKAGPPHRREQRDMGVGTGNLGGYLVPQGFVYKVEEALKYYGNMLGISQIMDTASGNPLPYPTSNDTTVVGEIVGEGVQVTDADVTIGHIIFGAFKFSTKMVKCSIELMQDSAFSIEDFL